MRVVSQNLSPELTLVEKVVVKLLLYNYSLIIYMCFVCIQSIC